MSESKEQSKVLKWLKANGYWVFKTVVCNRSGIQDIIALSPEGLFVAIEMKFDRNKASKLQEYNIREVNKRKGLSFVAYSLEEVKEKLA